mgnify:CR=1 FL=1
MREMKDSGIEWIGKIPLNWICSKQKYALSLLNGRAFSDTEFLGEGKYRVLRVGNIFTNPVWYYSNLKLDDSKYCDKGDLLYTWSMSYAPVIWTGEKVIYHYHIWKVLPRKFINKRFAFYYLQALTLALKSEIHETTMGFITMGIMNNAYIAYGSLKEQQAIANFLDAKCADIDSLTADIQKQINILKEYKKSVITQAVTKGLDPNVEMKNTASPYWNKIPKKWCLSDIKYIFKIVKRIAGKEGFDILSVTQKGLKIKDTSRNEGQIAENYKGYQFVYPGDFVMNHMDLLTGWVDLSKLFGVTSPDYRVFKLRDNIQNEAGYYKYVMQCCYSCRIFYSLGQGVSTLGRWRLQTSVFNNFLLPVPPTTEQKAIADFLDAKCADIDAAIAGKQKQLDVLKEYKKSLIYEYVTGKKEVPCRE